VDTDIHQTALAYGYQKGRHRLGLEANRFDRDPDTGADTEAYRLSAYWSYSFGRPTRPVTARPVAQMDNADVASLPTLLELKPGLSLAAVQKRLTHSRLVPAYRLSSMEVYEARLLDEIGLRQRLVLTHDAGDLSAATLVLYFEDAGNPNGMVRDYARVRDLLLKSYGAPENYQEEGAFGPNLSVELAMGRFERMLEWRTESGRLRFGIPQRLDGQVRMEIMHAPSIPAGRNWGIDALR